MNIRLIGRSDEIDVALARLRAVFPVVVSVSARYPCRGADTRVRVYVEVVS